MPCYVSFIHPHTPLRNNTAPPTLGTFVLGLEMPMRAAINLDVNVTNFQRTDMTERNIKFQLNNTIKINRRHTSISKKVTKFEKLLLELKNVLN